MQQRWLIPGDSNQYKINFGQVGSKKVKLSYSTRRNREEETGALINEHSVTCCTNRVTNHLNGHLYETD